MSNEEFYSDEEEYEFEFEEGEEGENESGDEIGEEEQEYLLENKYYTAKNSKYEDVNSAIKQYKAIIQSDIKDNDAIEWAFKSYKQIMKIYFNLKDYDQVLTYLDGALHISNTLSNKNYVEESLNKIINNYSINSNEQFIDNLYDKILNFAKNNSYDRLWLKININKARLLLQEPQEWERLIEEISEKLKTVSQTMRYSFALEIIAIKIEFYTIHFDLKKLAELYRESSHITSAVTHPKILGIIKECGGKIQFYRGNYEKARLTFYESFKSFDEAGSPLKKKILKYLALCAILTENEFNPFEAQETQAYAQLLEYKNLINLSSAYDNDDLDQLNEIMNQMKLEDDPIVNDHIFIASSSKIVSNLKVKAIANYLKAYKSLPFEVLLKKFSITLDELEGIFFKLVSSGKITNTRFDFLHNMIVSTNEVHEPICSILPQETYKNMIAIDMLGGKPISNLSEHNMDIDSNIYKTNNSNDESDNNDEENELICPRLDDNSVIHRFLYLTELPSKAAGWDRLISEFQEYLASAIPNPLNFELSQKDQIFSMQRADQEAGKKGTNDSEHNSGKDNDNYGNFAMNEFPVDAEVKVPVSKPDMLMKWSLQVESTLDDLTRKK